MQSKRKYLGDSVGLTGKNSQTNTVRKIKDEVGNCVQRVKLHRWPDLSLTNKLRDGIDIVTVATWAGMTIPMSHVVGPLEQGC